VSIYIPSFVEQLTVARSHGRQSKVPGLWNGLVGYWPLAAGGGTTAFDLSGYGNHGTLTNMDPAADWVVTEKGRALDFDGDDDAVIGGVNVPFATSNVTISTWLYLTGHEAWSTVFGKTSTRASSAYNWGMFFDGGGDRLCLCRNGVFVTASTISRNKWLHIVGWASDTNAKLYINQTLKYTKGSGLGVGVTANTATKPVRWMESDAYNTGGSVNATAVWDRALLPSEIQQLYADPHCMVTLRPRVFPAATVTAVADYTVTGTINPDATGDYTQNGTHNGQPAYDRDGDGAYWIWANVGGLWFISAAKDTTSPGWERDADTITGAYPAVAPATGTATVAAAVTSVIMNQMQFGNLGADLYNGALSV